MQRAEHLAPYEAVAEAVKTYLRLYRGRVVEDAEMLAALLPDRFAGERNISDYQRYVIERLIAENAALKTERDGLRRTSDRASLMREGVKRLVLELLDARNFEEAIAIAVSSAPTMQADAAALGVECDARVNLGRRGICLLPMGFVGTVLARDAAGAVIAGGVYPSLFGDTPMQSVAIFRLRLGAKAPPALFALGARAADRFADDGEAREIGYFVRALERTIGTWLDLPKS